MNILSQFSLWLHNRKALRKRGHKYRYRQAHRVMNKLNGIRGKNRSETFARRLGYLRKIDPLTFEELVLSSFERHGYKVKRNHRYSGDGGLDGQIYRPETKQWVGVQCKRYCHSINWRHVEQFPRDLRSFGLCLGIFAHTGRTPTGHQLPHGVQLLSGQKLIDFICGRRDQ